RSARFPAEGDGGDGLVRRAGEELVLERHLEISQTAARRPVRRGIEEAPLAAERDAEVREDPLRELARDVRELPGLALAAAGLLDVQDGRERELVGHERIVDGERGREEALPRHAV